MPDTPANVLDFLPAAERAAIRAGRSRYDCTAGIQKAIEKNEYLPAGNSAHGYTGIAHL